MADPSIKKKLKTDGLSGACDKLKMNVLSKNLFVCMAENGRVSNFEGVIASFNSLMSAHRGEVICEVTTAKVSIKNIFWQLKFGPVDRPFLRIELICTFCSFWGSVFNHMCTNISSNYITF